MALGLVIAAFFVGQIGLISSDERI